MTTAGQGRMAAVLFTDLVGSTELLSRLGEAAFDGLRRAHFAALREAIGRSGGAEVKGTGDGVLATFSSAADAVACAVGMQQAVEVHGRTAGVPLVIRVGLSVGDVSFEDGDVFGTPVVEAARLVAVARGGQILATALVRGIAGGRSAAGFTDVGCLELKGLPTPVAACEVAWEPLPLSSVPMPALLTDMGRIFVGREAQVDRLEHLWNEVGGGERRAVFVAGEPGIGKTRLAAELAARVHADGAAVLAGRCDEDLGVPYQPFVEALRHFVDHTQAEHLGRRLGRYAGDLARLLPELTARLPDLLPPLNSDPETERYRLFDAVASWIGAVSCDEPVLLVLDDLQWAAKPTLLLLRHLLQSPDLRRLLVLGTYRDTELRHDHPLVEVVADLRRTTGVERISLVGLDSSGVAAFMERAAGHELGEDARALARAIHLETEGNPFFVREVLRHLGETGAVERHDGRWTTRRSVEELGIPDSVRDVVGRRLSRLSREANQMLRVAAVVGAEFELPVLEAAGRLNDETLLATLEEAAHARVVTEASATRYRFSHALVRATLYEQLAATRRARIHLHAADFFEDDAPRLAHHLLAAAPLADSTRTARACLAAGDRALAVLADAEAGEWFAQGLPLIEEPSLRIDLLTGLGEAQRRTGVPSSRDTLLDAARLAADRRDVPRLVRAVLANSRGMTSVVGDVEKERLELIGTALDLVGPEPTGERAELLALQASELVFVGGHHLVLRSADEAAAMAAHVGDVTVQARVGLRRLFACHVPDRVTSVAFEGAQVVAFADATGDPQLRALSRGLSSGHTLLAAGDLGEARRRAAESMTIADEAGQPGLRCVAHFEFAAATDALGDHEVAARLTHAGCEIGQQLGWSDAMMWYGARMALHWTFEGQPDAAAAVAAQGYAEYPRMVAWEAYRAVDLALAGRDEELVALISTLPGLLSRVPMDFLWLLTHFWFAAAMGFGVEDSQTAAALYDLLLPYRSLHASYRIGYVGPIEVALAIAARVRGDPERARVHHEAAAATIDVCGAARARALNGHQWARTLFARDAPGDRERALELARETLAYCRSKGYLTFVAKTEQLLDRIR